MTSMAGEEEEKFAGCLLGLAIGDALGMPLEGMPPQAIARYGPVRDFLPSPPRGLKPGQFTDDTQMAIYLAESIVERGRVDPPHVARRFVDWLRSGDVRGIGRSTLLSLRRLAEGASWQESGQRGEYAAGNGAAMRIAPVGLLDSRALERLRQDVHDVSIITHHNPEAVAGALAVAYAVARLVSAQADLGALLEEVVEFIGPCRVADNLTRAGKLRCLALPKCQAPVSTAEALATLGTSGYVVHTVASAFYCFLKTPHDFEETVIAAVMGGHDTDTTGAVAGAIAGAYHGREGIPGRWLAGVEDRDRLERLAREIYAIAISGQH